MYLYHNIISKNKVIKMYHKYKAFTKDHGDLHCLYSHFCQYSYLSVCPGLLLYYYKHHDQKELGQEGVYWLQVTAHHRGKPKQGSGASY